MLYNNKYINCNNYKNIVRNINIQKKKLILKNSSENRSHVINITRFLT